MMGVRIPSGSLLLEQNEYSKIGELIDLSQLNAEKYLDNQTPETIYLQRLAREIGAFASSAFGAGFGGSVYGFVKTSDAEKFCVEWEKNYVKRFPEFVNSAQFFIAKPAESVF